MQSYFTSPIAATRALERAIDRDGFAHAGAVNKYWSRHLEERTTWVVDCMTRDGLRFTLLAR